MAPGPAANRMTPSIDVKPPFPRARGKAGRVSGASLPGSRRMTSRLRPDWPPALLAMGVQAVAWLLLWLGTLMAPVGLSLGSMPLVLAQGIVAALLSRVLGLPGWWQLINGLFFPAVILAGRLEIPSHWYLAGFLLLLLTSLGTVFTRVPLYLSSRQAMREVARRLPAGGPPRVVDLGCGLGGMLAYLARHRPEARLHGVDAAPLPWLFGYLRLRGKARIRLGSLWDENLADYDVVYAYLSPAPMERLWRKARQEMRPGSLFISNSFAVPGVEPDERVELHDLSRARLLIWRMP